MDSVQIKNRIISMLLGPTPDTMTEAEKQADAILKLIEPRGESELREALEPFAKAYQAMLDLMLEETQQRIDGARQMTDRDALFELAKHLNMEMFVRARQALATPSAPVSGLVAEALDRVQAFLDASKTMNSNAQSILGRNDAHLYEADLIVMVRALKSALASRDAWRPEMRTDWENAPRDRSPVLLKFKPAPHPVKGNWPSYIVARHSGLPEDSDFDYNGWGVPGHGGWIDEDFEGFLPLPTPPTSQERKS